MEELTTDATGDATDTPTETENLEVEAELDADAEPEIVDAEPEPEIVGADADADEEVVELTDVERLENEAVLLRHDLQAARSEASEAVNSALAIQAELEEKVAELAELELTLGQFESDFAASQARLLPWLQVEDVLKNHSVSILRPGLVDPFARATDEYGFIVEFREMGRGVGACNHRGVGTTLSEALAGMEDLPKK